MNLNEDTREALQRFVTGGVRLSVISRESGINYRWLDRYWNGRIQDPGVNSVQTLHDWLTSQSDGERERMQELSKGKGKSVNSNS